MTFEGVAVIIIVGAIICGIQVSGIFDDRSIEDPTYDEMMQFIQEDTTNYHSYIPGSYVCEDFSEDVVDNAREQKIRAAVVHLEDSSGYSGHAIVCFETTDKGIYFLEPQLDIVFSEDEMDRMVDEGSYYVETYINQDTKAHVFMGLESYQVMNYNNTPGFEMLLFVFAIIFVFGVIKYKGKKY